MKRALLIFSIAVFFLPNLILLAQNQELNIIDDLKTIDTFNNLNHDDIAEMAQEIIQSQLNYERLKIRLIRYSARGILPFSALERAIKLEKLHETRKHLLSHAKKYDAFYETLNLIETIVLNKKVFRAYAYCVYPFKTKEFRSLLTPRLGQAVDSYSHTRHHGKTIWRTKPSEDFDVDIAAFMLLILESKKVTEIYELSAMEKVMMAKCISEQSLRFFSAKKHPVKALMKTTKLYTQAPEKAFFSNTGVCNNFCALTYNIALKLGVNDLFVAHRHLHSYLELKVDGLWYHTHPFSNVGNYDFLPFPE